MKNNNIVILLATYNGERFLKEQIESLYEQTYTQWDIYVHDDGSSDNTIQILEEYEKEKDNFHILRYPSMGGSANNFFSLLKRVKAQYYFFADQDDKWLQDKVESSLIEIKKMEQKHPGSPILICSDVAVTDINLNIMHPSLWKESNTHPEFLNKYKSAPIPFVTGCTMLINNYTKYEIEWDKINKATMHDAYITLCTLKHGGYISPINKPLLLYRQHGDNTLGAFSKEKSKFTYKFFHLKEIIRNNIGILKMIHAIKYCTFYEFISYKRQYKKLCKHTDCKKI